MRAEYKLNLQINEDRENVNDVAHLYRPSTSKTDENIWAIKTIILKHEALGSKDCFRKLITGVKSWVYVYGMETKERRFEYLIRLSGTMD